MKKYVVASKVCFEQSAKAGCPWGMLRHGDYCKIDERFGWYAKALDTNDTYACGRCFFFGLGVEENREKAREYLLRAAQQGNPFAQRLIADHRLCGSERESAFWMEKAAMYGDANAQYDLAWKYQNGRGVERSNEKALLWFLQGARQKHSACCREVARCYQNGLGCEKNFPMSAVFYLEFGDAFLIIKRLSAKFDDPVVRLQELFVYGKGLKKNAKLRDEIGGKKMCECCSNLRREHCCCPKGCFVFHLDLQTNEMFES